MADEPQLELRERDGSLEFVINLRHLPIVVETWFGGPSAALIDRYIAWLEPFWARAAARNQRLVFLHDASRSGLPDSAARQRITQIPEPPEVLIDRVIVFNSPVVRSAVSALSWIVGSPYKTARDLPTGLEMCRAALERERLDGPPSFTLTPEQPSGDG